MTLKNTVSIGEIKMKCKICKDVGWVCETHPNELHEHEIYTFPFHKKRCGGAGMPCKCNKANPPWNYHNQIQIKSLTCGD